MAWTQGKLDACTSNRFQKCSECWAAWWVYVVFLLLTLGLVFGYITHRQRNHVLLWDDRL